MPCDANTGPSPCDGRRHSSNPPPAAAFASNSATVTAMQRCIQVNIFNGCWRCGGERGGGGRKSWGRKKWVACGVRVVWCANTAHKLPKGKLFGRSGSVCSADMRFMDEVHVLPGVCCKNSLTTQHFTTLPYSISTLDKKQHKTPKHAACMSRRPRPQEALLSAAHACAPPRCLHASFRLFLIELPSNEVGSQAQMPPRRVRCVGISPTPPILHRRGACEEHASNDLNGWPYPRPLPWRGENTN